MPYSSMPHSSMPHSSMPHAAHISPAHVVVVVEENHSYADVMGDSTATYLHSLAAAGASLTHMYAIAHPSEPNYLALLSGSTQGLSDDSCPHRYSVPSLVGRLRAAHHTFIGFSEGLPNTGYSGCIAGSYVRRHVPWTDFTDTPAGVNRPFTAMPTDLDKLPTVSFVIPNLAHDMHDGTIADADTWLRRNLDGYQRWAATHNSLLIVTWDEDDRSASNHIPTLMVGAHIRPGHYSQHTDLYGLLRTLEWFYDLSPLGVSAHRTPLSGMWVG
jgi:acid phosphatase